MKFSIIIPCYNMAQLVGEAIESVRAQIYKNWECIIVDDCSTDDSLRVIRDATLGDHRFKVIHNSKNLGVAESRNKAIAASDGEYILPLDADDKLRNYALSEFAYAWQVLPDARLLVPKVYKYGNGVSRICNYDWYGLDDMRAGIHTLPNSCCYKRSDYNRAGGYRNGTMIEDYEFYIRLLDENAVVVNLDYILLDYRVCENSRWMNAKQRYAEEMDIVREMNPEVYKEDGKA